MVLAGIQTIWKCLESLNSKRIKHHLTAVGRPRAGCGERCSTWYQHLGSALSHTQALGQSFFPQFGGKWLLVIFCRRM